MLQFRRSRCRHDSTWNNPRRKQHSRWSRFRESFDSFIPDDIVGTISVSNSHNIFGSAVDGATAGDLQGVDGARLFSAIDLDTRGGVLVLYGGPTPTVALRDALDNPDVSAFEFNRTAISRTPSANNDVLTGTAAADFVL